MKRFMSLKSVQIAYIGFLSLFIAYYLVSYRPYKAHRICAEESAKTVLETKTKGDSYQMYQNLYKNCVSEQEKIF